MVSMPLRALADLGAGGMTAARPATWRRRPFRRRSRRGRPAAGLVELVGGEQNAAAASGEVTDHTPHDLAAADVDRCRRLVEEHHLGSAGQGEGEARCSPPDSCSAGGAGGEPDQSKGVGVLLPAVEVAEQPCHLVARMPGSTPGLEHHPGGRRAGRTAGVETGPTRRWPGGSLEDLDGRRLAGTVGAEHGGDPAGVGRERARRRRGGRRTTSCDLAWHSPEVSEADRGDGVRPAPVPAASPARRVASTTPRRRRPSPAGAG